MVLCFSELDVFGDVDQDWARPTSESKFEGFVDSVSEVLDVAHQEIVLGNGLCHTNDIGLLESVAPDKRTRYLSSDGNDGGRVHVGGSEPSDQVGGAGTTGCYTYADLPSRASVAIGGMGRGLLVAHEHMAQSGVLGESVIKGHDSPNRVAIEQLYAFTHQRFAEYLASTQLSSVLQALLTCPLPFSCLRMLLLHNCRSNNHEQ